MKTAVKNSITIVLIAAIAYFAVMVATAVAGPSSDEKVILDLINNQRTVAGLPDLKWGPKLHLAAKRHSRDMIDNDYFAHTSPSGDTLADRLKKSGIAGWTSAGENLAGASTPKIVFDLWMKSPAHKANMLKPKYNKVGIAVIEGGPYGMMITMDLAHRPLSIKALKLSKTKLAARRAKIKARKAKRAKLAAR